MALWISIIDIKYRGKGKCLEIFLAESILDTLFYDIISTENGLYGLLLHETGLIKVLLGLQGLADRKIDG